MGVATEIRPSLAYVQYQLVLCPKHKRVEPFPIDLHHYTLPLPHKYGIIYFGQIVIQIRLWLGGQGDLGVV